MVAADLWSWKHLVMYLQCQPSTMHGWELVSWDCGLKWGKRVVEDDLKGAGRGHKYLWDTLFSHSMGSSVCMCTANILASKTSLLGSRYLNMTWYSHPNSWRPLQLPCLCSNNSVSRKMEGVALLCCGFHRKWCFQLICWPNVKAAGILVSICLCPISWSSE